MGLVVVFLQNAWSPFYAGRRWPRRSWLRALATSRSGLRLKLMIDDLDLCEETTPVVTPLASGVAPPDPDHIRACLQARSPQLVVACGKQAEHALRELWRGPLLAVPHPAHRLLTNDLYVRARTFLVPGFDRRLALRQDVGAIREVSLGDDNG